LSKLKLNQKLCWYEAMLEWGLRRFVALSRGDTISVKHDNIIYKARSPPHSFKIGKDINCDVHECLVWCGGCGTWSCCSHHWQVFTYILNAFIHSYPLLFLSFKNDKLSVYLLHLVMWKWIFWLLWKEHPIKWLPTNNKTNSKKRRQNNSTNHNRHIRMYLFQWKLDASHSRSTQ
jgi:hypothetical protein